MNNMVYKLNTVKKRNYFFNFLFIAWMIDIVLVGIFGYLNQFEMFKLLKLTSGILCFSILFYLGPLIFLYVNYTKENKRQEFIFTSDSFLIFTDEKATKTFNLSDIINIEIHLSKTAYEKRMKCFFWDELFYYRLVAKNGELIIITCFVGDDLEKYFSPNKIKRVKRLFPKIR